MKRSTQQGGEGAPPPYPRPMAIEAQVWRWTLRAQGQPEPWLQQDAALAELRAAHR